VTRATFHMRNDPADVDRAVVALKCHVANALGTAGLFRFELSLAEALANVVKHATTSAPDAPVVIEFEVTRDAVQVEICDPIGAAPFDLRDHAHPLESIDLLAEEGRGLGLILNATDHMDYRRKADRMCLFLTFLKSKD